MIAHSRTDISLREKNAIIRQLDSGLIACGEKCNKVEIFLKDHFNAHYAEVTSSGKAALIKLLLMLGVNKNDEVMIPTYVCHSVADAVLFIGAVPVFADIDADYILSEKSIKEKITSKTKAIVLVHIFGNIADTQKFLKIAAKHKLLLIEDIAQSIGNKTGLLSDGCFGSFNATKMVASGEGGFFAIRKQSSIKKSSEVCDFGAKSSDLTMALAMEQLKRLPKFIQQRKVLAQKYITAFSLDPSIKLPVSNCENSLFFRFIIQLPEKYDFSSVQAYFKAKGIHIRKGVDELLHQKYNTGNCPNAELLFTKTFSLPIYPALKSAEQKKIINTVLKFLGV